jgi:chemotaxis protein methyltransferase WspC
MSDPSDALTPPEATIELVLREWIGLDLATVGRTSLRRAIRSRLQARGSSDVAWYATVVASDRSERDALVEEMVVAESWFFRDPQVFELVARFAITCAALPGRTPIRILSAPCASGEEPYSVAMALLDAGLPPEQFAIDAIDVSRAALERAAAGRYSANAFRNADLSFRDRWFRTVEGRATVDQRIRSRVNFAWANLLDSGFAAGRGRYDVIFCRNLLIYLDPPARAGVEATLDALLQPDGLLVLGAAEPPIMRGGWIPAGSASCFALRRPPARGPSARESGREGRPIPGQRPPSRAPASNAPRIPATYDAREGSPPETQSVLDRAAALANAGRHGEALALCERAGREAPPSPELFFLMGMLHQATGDLDRAEGCLHKTLYLDATHDEALLALALLAEQRGDRRMAETYRASAARALARKEQE